MAAADTPDTPTTAEENCGPPPRNRKPRPVAVAIARLRGRLMAAVARGGVGGILVAQQVRCQPTGCRNLFGNLTKSQLQNEERDKLNSAPPVFQCEAGGGCGNSGIAAEFNSFFVHLRWFGASAPGGGCALPLCSLHFHSAHSVVWLLQRIGRLSKFLDSRDDASCENERQKNVTLHWSVAVNEPCCIQVPLRCCSTVSLSDLARQE